MPRGNTDNVSGKSTGKTTKTATTAKRSHEAAAKRAEQVAKRTESATGRSSMRASAGTGKGKTVAGATRGGRFTARKATTGRRAAVPTSIDVSPAARGNYTAEGPVTRVVDALGNNVVADLLGVAHSQPSQWRSGKERPSPESRKRISDLDHILDRLLLELHPEQAGIWLTGSNPHLGGARPVDVLELRGAAAVLPAIDALAAGAFV